MRSDFKFQILRSKSSGFTLVELMVAIAILLVMLAIGIPVYQKNLRTRATQGAARVLESAIRERKGRAVALGKDAGLCVGGDNVVRLYEYHPFAPTLSQIAKIIDLNQSFGVPVSAVVAPPSMPPAGSPCPGDALIALTANVDPSGDWQGTITLTSGDQSWHIIAKPGVLNDSP